MPTAHKVYRFRMEPNREQEAFLIRESHTRRFVWNWALEQWDLIYKATGKSPNAQELAKRLVALKREPDHSWLAQSDSQAMLWCLRDLERAIGSYFKKVTKFPAFKSRKRDLLRYRTTRVAIKDGKVFVPKLGWVRIRQSRPIDGVIKSGSFKRSATGHWFLCLHLSFETPDLTPTSPDPERFVGIDLGLKEFAVLSNGERIEAPKFFRRDSARLRRANRSLRRKQLGSKRREKARALIARIYERIVNQRADFTHKLSARLVAEHDGLAIENLNVQGWAKIKLGKSLNDAPIGMFARQLEYKSPWNHKNLAIIDRWFPSSKMHAKCGYINGNLTMRDRTWVCDCGETVDRDLNAAVNIRDEGLRILAVGQTDRQNARGRDVRPPSGGNPGRTENPASHGAGMPNHESTDRTLLGPARQMRLFE